MSLSTVVTDAYAAAKARADAYVNALKGLGDAIYDALAYTTTKTAESETPEYYENLIEVNAIARRIAALPAREMLRAGYELQVPEDVEYDELPLMDELKRLHATTELVWAMTLARATGGAVIVPMIVDGTIDFREPLNLEAIREIQELRVVSRKYAYPVAPGSPIYRITSPGDAKPPVDMHKSRLIIFDGVRLTEDHKARNQGWGHSVFVALEDSLKRLGTSWQALGNMLVDGSQGLLKVKGFHSMLASAGGGDNAIRTRFHLMAHGRSVARTTAVDADGEDFQFVNRNFAGIDSSIFALMSELSSETGIPITKLFGRSAAGMNATGEGDARDWLNEVEADRSVDLEPNHEKLIRMVMRTKAAGGVEPKRWSIAYKPGWQPSEKEQAEVRKLQAETDAIYIGQQVTMPEEIGISRFGGKDYSTATQIDLGLRKPGETEEDGPKPGDVPTGGGEDVQKSVLNGAQIAAAMDIVKSVAEKAIPRESGKQLLLLSFASFGLTDADAEKLLGDAGNGFEPQKEEPKDAPPRQPGNPAPDRDEDVPG